MIPNKFVTELQRAERYFNIDAYKSIIESARNALDDSRYKDFQRIMKSIPTNDELLTKLVEKLKGKSVYTTLTKVLEKKVDNNYDSLKCLFSLGTHVAIECKTSPEYKALLPVIYEQLSKMIYGMD